MSGGCRYCGGGNPYRTDLVDHFNLTVGICNDCGDELLVASAWDGDLNDIAVERVPVNFCPMCGRDLRRHVIE